MTFQVNPAAKPYFSHVGSEKTPVLIMDNFMQNLDTVLLNNLNDLQFNDFPTYYPGIRANLPEQYIIAVAKAMMGLIRKMYAIPNDFKVEFFESYYSLVTKKPTELSLEQRIPHFDGTDNYRFALIHYLNPSSHGGTAFYRHKATNLERVFEDQVDHYLDTVSDEIHNKGIPAAKYIEATNQQFERIGEVPYVQNRMALYPGNLLHSGTINPTTDINSDPLTGRLTANIFLNFIPE